MFELYVVETVAVSAPGIALACQVRAGTVHVGDRVTRVRDAEGDSWPIDLEVRYLSMRKLLVDAMKANDGGVVTLFGLYNSVEPGHSLSC